MPKGFLQIINSELKRKVRWPKKCKKRVGPMWTARLIASTIYAFIKIKDVKRRAQEERAEH